MLPYIIHQSVGGENVPVVIMHTSSLCEMSESIFVSTVPHLLAHVVTLLSASAAFCTGVGDLADVYQAWTRGQPTPLQLQTDAAVTVNHDRNFLERGQSHPTACDVSEIIQYSTVLEKVKDIGMYCINISNSLQLHNKTIRGCCGLYLPAETGLA